MSTVATPQLEWLADEWEELYASAVCSGIVGDPAHRKSGGYHISRQDQPKSNYSVTRTDDRGGPDNAAAAIDMSMSTRDMVLCTRRLVAVFNNPTDPRRRYINAFNGWLGDGFDAHRWDMRANVRTWATPDHRWHVHLEAHRRFVESMQAMGAILSALMGQQLSEFQLAREDEMELDDVIHWRTGGDVKYSQPTSTVEGAIASISYYGLDTRNKVVKVNNDLMEARADLAELRDVHERQYVALTRAISDLTARVAELSQRKCG